jgi:acetyl coenzyme A synthetase (ADP forming)-like protein
MTDTTSLTPFFDPKGVVVIGASQDPTKLGYLLATNLHRSGYKGAVHFVNLKGGTLLGNTIYRSVMDVPDPVDLAAVLIPSKFVIPTLRECGKRGIKAAIIGSGGFREIGSEGLALEQEMLQVAKEEGIRLLGPNCIGLLDTHLPLDTTFLPPPGPNPGDVAFLSHSGAICAAAIDWTRGQGYGISKLISLGNQADITETDLLAPTAADGYTNVIALYLEGIKSGRRFIHEARAVVPNTPIIALKVGRFAAGQRAAASHTGALSGEESAYNAVFRRAGVLRAETSEELFDEARALAWCPLPEGNRVAVLTNAGGPGVTAADALEARGLKMADFSRDTISGLQKILPSAASLQNPVDMLASAGPIQFADCLRVLLSDPGTDSVMVIYPTPPMHSAGAVAKALIPVIHQTQKPVVISVMGDRLIQEAVEHLRAARIPEYRFPERAAAALAALVKRVNLLDYASAEPVFRQDVQIEVVQDLIKEHNQNNHLIAPVIAQILEAYGIPTAKMTLAKDDKEAAALAAEIGLPVVLKIASPDISHKSDVGGVLLNLADEKSVRGGFQTITSQAKAALPNARITGVYVQEMVPLGQEVILGVVQDPQFGPVMMFGSGGTEVEGLKDLSFGLAPITEIEIDYMLQKTWAGRKLEGYRNIPPADIKAVREVMIRLGQLANDFPQFAEIEINPLRIFPAGKGASAVDVRVRLE